MGADPLVKSPQSIEETARRGGLSHIDRIPPSRPLVKKPVDPKPIPYLDIDGDGIRPKLVRIPLLGVRQSCHR